VARWRGSAPQRIEPPEWYRNYHPEDWDEPDGQELSMMRGSHGPWPGELHDYHSQRRWEQARHRYRQEHPLLATQEIQEIIGRHKKRRLS
jgi:hypothetical protein